MLDPVGALERLGESVGDRRGDSVGDFTGSTVGDVLIGADVTGRKSMVSTVTLCGCVFKNVGFNWIVYMC